LPIDIITGNPDKYATLWYSYLNVWVQSSETCVLNDITTSITPAFLSDEELVLEPANQCKLFIPKKLLEDRAIPWKEEVRILLLGDGDLTPDFL